ncbi:MAG: VCBS repeat-containing protein [Planctomycetota bacterium]
MPSLLRDGVTGDLDGDGDLDLLAVRWAGGPAQLLLRNGGGRRLVDVTSASLPADSAASLGLVLFDMDGDGDLDLFVSKAGAPRLLRNRGAGTFVDASSNLPPGINSTPAVVAADFDGDGGVDIAIGGNLLLGNQTFVLRNSGLGTFTAVQPIPGGNVASMVASSRTAPRASTASCSTRATERTR